LAVRRGGCHHLSIKFPAKRKVVQAVKDVSFTLATGETLGIVGESCIARTLACEPRFIICDESVSALDVSVQAQVLNLLKDLQQDFGLTYIFISHDLSVVKFVSDRIMVMNQGRIEEIGTADSIYNNPQRDYTRQLIQAIPDSNLEDIKARQLNHAARVT
jgi:peptide/nickel transport system ATP-binding protein